MIKGEIQVTARDSIEFSSIDEMDEILDQLHEDFKEQPYTVDVIIPPGDILSIALGLEESILSFTSHTLAPPYFASKGDSTREDLTIVIHWNERWNEFPQSQLIPIEAARSAVREFVETGKLSKKIEWEEV